MKRVAAAFLLLWCASTGLADAPHRPPARAAAAAPGMRVIRATVARLRAAVREAERAVGLARSDAERGLLEARLQRSRIELARAVAVERRMRRTPVPRAR